MAKHNKLGKEGELIAFMFLQREGLKILHSNWRYQRAEVDLIAQDGDFLVFIEVKTRGNKKYGKPSDAIDKKKIALYKDAAEAYIKQYPSQLEIRFNVINIIIEKDNIEIEHIPEAF